MLPGQLPLNLRCPRCHTPCRDSGCLCKVCPNCDGIEEYQRVMDELSSLWLCEECGQTWYDDKTFVDYVVIDAAVPRCPECSSTNVGDING